MTFCLFLQTMDGSLKLISTTAQNLSSENEKLRVNELKIDAEIEDVKRKLAEANKKWQECEQMLENERLQWRKSSKNERIEFEELSDKFKIIEQQNANLRAQCSQMKADLMEIEDENSGLRENERRRSMEGNTNSEHLSEKINLQRQLRTIREERDCAEKRLSENDAECKQLSLKFHQISLQFESAQQRVAQLDADNEKLKASLDEKMEKMSAMEAEKFALSKKNNLIYDGNVDLEEKNKKSQQALGKLQGKNDRLRQQRDYAKSKYKELKAKFNALELQFNQMQSRYSSAAHQQQQQQKMTSTTLPF